MMMWRRDPWSDQTWKTIAYALAFVAVMFLGLWLVIA